MFGGADLATMFVTTSRHRLTDAQRADQPLAGAVLVVDAGVRGRPGNTVSASTAAAVGHRVVSVGRFESDVVLVTGGARGIGRATVERFVAEGADVVFCDLDADPGEQAAAEIGDRSRFQRCDVADEDQVVDARGPLRS